MDCAVLIATYGDKRWAELAQTRAYPSALGQGAKEVFMEHVPNGTIALVRNDLAKQSRSEWLCFLDADDELAPGYLAGMERALSRESRDVPLLLTPAVSYVVKGRPQAARFWPECEISQGNWMVIGTLIERSFFFELGGFRNWGDPPGSNAYEDWGLWASAQLKGARVVRAKRSTYIAHMEAESRHRQAPPKEKLSWHYEIGHALFPDEYGPNWMKGRR